MISFSEFVHGIRNLISFAPIVWHDRDYDYRFLLDLLEFKLARMQRRFEKHINLFESAPDIICEIGRCRDALQRYMDDDYCADEHEAHHEKWGNDVCPVCGEFACGCFPDRNGTAWHLVTIPEKVVTEQDLLQEQEEYRALMLKEAGLRKADLEAVFNIMKGYIEGWWD